MHLRIVLFCITLSALAGAPLPADQVTMKNGDRFTGSILKCDGKNLTIKSDYAGPVTVPWDAVVSIQSSAPLHFGLADGQTVVGAVTTTDGKLQIQTKDTGTVATAKAAIRFIRSKEEQAAYETEIERYRNPRLVDLWTGFVDLGYSQTRGNARTSNVAVSANASRKTGRDRINVTFTSLYASTDTTGKPTVTANAIRGGLNYELNVSPKAFAFGSVDLEFDEFQKLDLRFAPAGGFGYRALKNEATTLDLYGGASLNREFFATGLQRTSGEALIGEELTHKFSASLSLREKLAFYPNVTNRGNYRINFDTSAVATLRKWLAWQVSLSNRFLSNPVPGRQRNDVLLTTGIRLTFAK